jgi:hypothetical protein
MNLKWKRDFKTYKRDIDILWNRTEVGEKQTLVIFVGGIEMFTKKSC